MKQTATETRYREIYEKELVNLYPAMDEIEATTGYAIEPQWLNEAARVLNCPVKVNAPNWQHGRLIYSTLCSYIKQLQEEVFIDMDSVLLDIGTAKGLSAVVMAKALYDCGETLPVYSVDIVDPGARVVRNSIAEVDGLKTVPEFVAPFLPQGQKICYYGDGSINLLLDLVADKKRVLFAFVDGKHSYRAVVEESAMLSNCQKIGDIIIFDDCQIPQVDDAVNALTGYSVKKIQNGPRKYAVARKL